MPRSDWKGFIKLDKINMFHVNKELLSYFQSFASLSFLINADIYFRIFQIINDFFKDKGLLVKRLCQKRIIHIVIRFNKCKS